MNQKLAKDAAVLTAAKIITMLIALVSSMLLSRFRTLEEYGTYSQLLIVVTLATSLFTLGLPNSTNYFLARAENQKERQKFLSVYYTLNTILCFVIGVVLAFTVPVAVSYFSNPLIKDFAYFLVVLPWTKVIIGSISNVLVVYGKTVKLMVLNAVNACTALAAVLIVRILGWSFREYMLLYLLGEAMIMLWVYMIVWRLESPLRFSLDAGLIKTIFKFSIPIGLAALVGTVNIEIDKLMIGKFFDTASLALYTNAGKELPLTLIATSLTAVLLPQMAKLIKDNNAKKAVALWGSATELSYIFMSFFVTVCLVFAPQIITVLYSEKYLAGTNVFRVYSLVLLLRTAYYGIVLNSMGKTKFILYCSIISLGLNVILNYFFYCMFGFIGPALATFACILLVGILQLLITAKTVEIKFKHLFPWKRLMLHTVLNMAWGTLALVLIKMLKISTSMRDVMICILSGFFVTVLYGVVMFKPIKKCWKELNGSK